MGKKGFRELIVWQKAKDLAVTIYRVSEEGALSRDYGLRDQIRRSAVSVASNLAEGDERDTDKESVRFFYIAKGSLAERNYSGVQAEGYKLSRKARMTRGSGV